MGTHAAHSHPQQLPQLPQVISTAKNMSRVRYGRKKGVEKPAVAVVSVVVQ